MRASMLLGAVAVLAVAAIAGKLWAGRAEERRLSERGAALYHGEAGLPARIVGHDIDLPAGASRCVNCHGTVAAAPAASATLAPALTARTLGTPQPRRGGPPSRYDAAALCTLLRSGVDPAYVMIPRTMPRYEITDADCAALWAHLAN